SSGGMSRRTLLSLPAALAVHTLGAKPRIDWSAERGRVVEGARAAMEREPLTITSASSPRSAGGRHDYFSEGDYWWPDPKDPDAPYVQRDGMTNPDNFVAHRQALIRFSVAMPVLTCAWLVTKERRFAA